MSYCPTGRDEALAVEMSSVTLIYTTWSNLWLLQNLKQTNRFMHPIPFQVQSCCMRPTSQQIRCFCVEVPSNPDTNNIPLRSLLTFCQTSGWRCFIYYNSHGNTNMSRLSAWRISGSAYLGRSLQWFRSLPDTGTDPQEPPIHPQLCSRCVGWPD